MNYACSESIQVYSVNTWLKIRLNSDFDVINERLGSYYT